MTAAGRPARWIASRSFDTREARRCRDRRTSTAGWRCALWVRDNQEGPGTFQRTIEGDPHAFRIERSKALVQDHSAGPLQQCAAHVDAAAFAMGKLPAAFSNHLQDAAGHPLQQFAESKFLAYRLCFLHVLG